MYGAIDDAMSVSCNNIKTKRKFSCANSGPMWQLGRAQDNGAGTMH